MIFLYRDHEYNLDYLMNHPLLVAASESFKSQPEHTISNGAVSVNGQSKTMKCIYVFKREHITVNPALVELIGTVGVVIRNPRTGFISVAHMNSPDYVETGLIQMLNVVDDHLTPNPQFDVHLIGGYEDVPNQQSSSRPQGVSYPMCSKIINTLRTRTEQFLILTLHVLRHNTKWDFAGTPRPMFHGFTKNTSDGSKVPARFDQSSRIPDEIVRRIRVTSAYEDPNWEGRLLDTYDTSSDCFVIAPCAWTLAQREFALLIQNFCDLVAIQLFSTSPAADGPRKADYLIQHPDCEETFPFRSSSCVSETC